MFSLGQDVTKYWGWVFMNKFMVLSLLSVSSVLVYGATPISSSLEEIFSEGVTKSKLPVEQPVYMNVIESKTSDRCTLVYRCRHIAAKSITDSIESATSPIGTVEVSSDQNMITINDVADQIEELKELLLLLDSRGPQVLVEAQIVEVQMGDGTEWDTGFNISYDGESSGGFQLGGNKGYPAKPGAFPDSSGSWFDVVASPNDLVNVNARLRWLKSSDKAEILSSPNLLVDLGATAAVSTGTDLPLVNVNVLNNGSTQESVYYKRTGVNLRVTPLLINDDTVNIQVRPEVTTVVGTASFTAQEAPIISVRNIDTTLNVRDGGIVMMGGLYSSRDIESEERVPVLSSIPFLGKLFTGSRISQEQVQLVFLLKVTVVPDARGSVLTNMDRTKREVKGTGRVLSESVSEAEAAGVGE